MKLFHKAVIKLHKTDANETDANETDANETDANETDANETDANETDAKLPEIILYITLKNSAELFVDLDSLSTLYIIKLIDQIKTSENTLFIIKLHRGTINLKTKQTLLKTSQYGPNELLSIL